MESPEQFTVSKDCTQFLKGKRTKRQRPSSTFGVAMTSSSSSGAGDDGRGVDGGGNDVYSILSSPTSDEISRITDEDEDMANCLILLAQSGCPKQEENEAKINKISSRRFTEAAVTTTGGKAGFYVYECKTCNRSFPSFQALGGHRTSHKKPKSMALLEDQKPTLLALENTYNDDHFDSQFKKISPPPPLSFQIINKSNIHECSVCGLKFSSGQALGGHMRRHRTSTSSQIVTSSDTNTTDPSSHEDDDKVRNVLSLDLNLPAPEDDHHDSKFQFESNQRRLFFSSPTLVDCHY